MTLGRNATWAACALVALLLVGSGAAFDRAFDTGVGFTLGGVAVAAAYLVWTFGASFPLFGGVSGRLRQPGCFALTFDDGPDPRYTSQISELLAARGHRATFFVLGATADRHPELVSQLNEDGHEVGLHSYDHGLLAFSLPSSVRRQLAKTEAAVMQAGDRPPARLFRAPHGVRSLWLGRALARSGYRLCGWDGRIFDTANPGVATIVARVGRELRPGAVILLHDGDGSGSGSTRQQTVDALPAILDEAEAQGLRSIPLSGLLSTSAGSTTPARELRRASAPNRRSPTA